MNQNEYDELKELIYKLKQYVDYQDKKMSMYAWCQAKAERGRYYDPAIGKICYLSSKEDTDKYTDSKLDEICHKINSEMIEMGIVHEKSGKMVFPFLDQVEYERRKSDRISTMIKQKADDITRRVNEDSTMDLGPSIFDNFIDSLFPNLEEIEKSSDAGWYIFICKTCVAGPFESKEKAMSALDPEVRKHWMFVIGGEEGRELFMKTPIKDFHVRYLGKY